jgi:hypothetical protein
MFAASVIEPQIVMFLQRLWLNDVPFKVEMFGWRLLLSKLPTHTALANRGVITNAFELSCVFCFREAEDIQHVLFNCRFSQQVWRKICCWMQVDNIAFEGVWSHFNLFGNLVQERSQGGTVYLACNNMVPLASTE